MIVRIQSVDPCLLCSYFSGSKLQVGWFWMLRDSSLFSIEKIVSNILMIFVDTLSIKLQYSLRISSKSLKLVDRMNFAFIIRLENRWINIYADVLNQTYKSWNMVRSMAQSFLLIEWFWSIAICLTVNWMAIHLSSLISDVSSLTEMYNTSKRWYNTRDV